MNIEQLVERSKQLANAGQWDEAERSWMEVLRLSPRHPQALFSLAVHALQRGESSHAVELLKNARHQLPKDLRVLMTLCAAFKRLGDIEGEREAIESALVVDPYFLPALLAKAFWLERFDGRASAATMYNNALAVAPPPTKWPPLLQKDLEHARDFSTRYAVDFDAFLAHELDHIISSVPSPLRSRWRESAAILSGRSKPYHAVVNQLCVPRLPAIPFFEREQFPFLATLEAKTEVIRQELEAALASAKNEFLPYIQYAPGEPVNQWVELNHSLRWSTLQLMRSGKVVQANLDMCPETAKVLAHLPLADIGGLCPNVMFSALAPKSRIPPHNGETNARVVAHLPLIVPEGCRYRVGFEWREWRVGETLIFDDTIEHEAINDSDELRVVLIFDLWNPFLTIPERELVRTLAAAARSFTAGASA